MSRHSVSVENNHAGPAGLVGKFPAQKDFVRLGPPQASLQKAMDWMSQGMQALPLRQDNVAREGYLSAPIWRFILNGNLFGSQPCLGALCPSTDMVGRLFPMLILAEFPKQQIDPIRTLQQNEIWYQAVETLLFALLDPHYPISALSQHLQKLPVAECTSMRIPFYTENICERLYFDETQLLDSFTLKKPEILKAQYRESWFFATDGGGGIVPHGWRGTGVLPLLTVFHHLILPQAVSQSSPVTARILSS